MREIVIVGAGAMGCLFAVRLADTGARVTLVDVDTSRLEALRRDGVTLVDDSGERTVRIRAGLAQEIVGPVDLVMLFTKAVHSQAAVRSIAHLAARAQALTLQNGIGNAEILCEIFPVHQVLVGVTDFPADLEGPTRVASHGRGHVRFAGFTSEAELGPVADLLNRAGLAAEQDPDVLAAIWEKVAFNAALNAIAAVTGRTVGGMDAPPGRRLAAAVAGEVVATAAAHGIALDREAIDRKIDFALTHHRSHKASMLQDLSAGRATEIEAINGAVVRAAREAGVSVPVTETLADLVRLMENP